MQQYRRLGWRWSTEQHAFILCIGDSVYAYKDGRLLKQDAEVSTRTETH